MIFDGGGDMYDIGNLIMTSLMGTPRGGVIGCDLGAIRYEADFTPIVSTCFGAHTTLADPLTMTMSISTAILAEIWVALQRSLSENRA